MNNLEKINELEYEITTLTGKKYAKARKAIRNKILVLKNNNDNSNNDSKDEDTLEILNNQLLLLTGKKNVKKRQEVIMKISKFNIENNKDIEKENNIKVIKNISKEDMIDIKKNLERMEKFRNKKFDKSKIKLYPSWYLENKKW